MVTVTSRGGASGRPQRAGPEPMPNGETVIAVTDLSFTYPTAERPSLQHLDLNISRGEFVGITGPSGAGKTTLCLCLKGLIPHAVPGDIDGDVLVHGRSVIDEPPGDLAREIAMVMQDPEAQIIGMTVAEDLAFGPENFQEHPDDIRRRSADLLAQVGLDGFINRDTYELSGGQKQRLAIASALMLRPDILVLDEPTAELDPIGKSEVFEIVKRLRDDSDVTIVMVEHETERLSRMADRLVVMEAGRTVADGTPADLMTDVQLFRRTGGERPPAVAELMWELSHAGLLGQEALTLDEDRAVACVRGLLGRAR